MRIATFNVNGINARLSSLLQWMAETRPNVVCLQELKAPQERFPIDAIRAAGYGAIWHGQKSWNGVAILAKDSGLTERRRALPGDPEDSHSRYVEAEAHGLIIGCLYLPNGNPAPGPKFDYKLRWFDRLHKHAGSLLTHLDPSGIAGFVAHAKAQGLMAGLAGSLTCADVPELLTLSPDLLGFRGALCRGQRSASLDPASCASIRALIPRIGAPAETKPSATMTEAAAQALC